MFKKILKKTMVFFMVAIVTILLWLGLDELLYTIEWWNYISIKVWNIAAYLGMLLSWEVSKYIIKVFYKKLRGKKGE